MPLISILHTVRIVHAPVLLYHHCQPAQNHCQHEPEEDSEQRGTVTRGGVGGVGLAGLAGLAGLSGHNSPVRKYSAYHPRTIPAHSDLSKYGPCHNSPLAARLRNSRTLARV